MRLSLKWQRFVAGLGYTGYCLFFVVMYRVLYKDNLAWWDTFTADFFFGVSAIVTLWVLVTPERE
jgi:hypothetical protein